MAHTFTQTRPQVDGSIPSALGRLVRDNVLRVGLVLVGMTLFIAAAEAKTPAQDLSLDALPELVTQIANQSATELSARIDAPYIARTYQASDDFAATVAPSNLLNSPAARFLADRLN
jgi:hypothetical protein